MPRLNFRLKALTGIRVRSGFRPDAGQAIVAAFIAVLIAVGSVEVILFLTIRSEATTRAGSIHNLTSQLAALEIRDRPQTDWPAIAALVLPSVVTISTDKGLGSGWVASSDESGSELVTNLHVVADALDAGVAVVDVAIGDRTFKGTITRTDVNNDLAVIHVDTWLPALRRAILQPQLAQSVMAIGSSLGLDGSVSIGVISGFRSIEGSQYIQFSAAISPGNSGGPVVDADGQVVAVATAKFVSPGTEALSLAIPIETVCRFAKCETPHL